MYFLLKKKYIWVLYYINVMKLVFWGVIIENINDLDIFWLCIVLDRGWFRIKIRCEL